MFDYRFPLLERNLRAVRTEVELLNAFRLVARYWELQKVFKKNKILLGEFFLGRNSNDLETQTFTISTNPIVVKRLKELVRTGYYGKNHAEAAERLLAQVLCEKFGESLSEETSE